MSETIDFTDHQITVFKIDVPEGMTPAEYLASIKLRSMKGKAPYRKKLLNRAQLMAEATRINGGPIRLEPRRNKPVRQMITSRNGYQK